MVDVVTCLRIAADSLSCARFFPSEADLAREYAAMAVAELPADLATQVERALDCGDYYLLDGMANALQPEAPTPAPRPRRQRKPSLAHLVAKAKKLEFDVTIEPDGAATFHTSASATSAVFRMIRHQAVAMTLPQFLGLFLALERKPAAATDAQPEVHFLIRAQLAAHTAP